MFRPPVNEFRLPEKRFVANVFVDLCGSTAAGEALKDSQQLFALLDRWQRLAAFLFCNYGGKIGASDSDMVMGYFVGSESGNLSMSRALLAACRIREQTVAFGLQASMPLDVHIGLHCGEVEVGLIGPDVRHNVTTIGPPVNITARLQSKAGKGEIIASSDLMRGATVHCEGEDAGTHALRGVATPVPCYRVRSVVVPTKCSKELADSDWVAAALEAQAFENTGREAQALELARIAGCCQCPPTCLTPDLALLPAEIGIRCLIGMHQSVEARDWIVNFERRTAELAAHRLGARACFYRGEALMQLAQYQPAVDAFDAAKQRYAKYGSGRDIADACFYSGLCYQCLGNLPQANAAFREARQRYFDFIALQDSEPVEVAKACLELSMLLDDDPRTARDVLSKAEKIFREACQFRHLVTVLLNLSCVDNRMLRPTHAENYSRRALELARDFDPVAGVGLAHGNIAAALENRGEFESAVTHYHKALEVAQDSGDQRRVQQLLVRLRRAQSRTREGELQ